MRLYLVQHGEAKSEAEDPNRPLTDKGAGHVRQVAAAAQAAGLVTIDRVLHSGKTRGRQTAEIWGETLGVKVDQIDGLSPNDDPWICIGRLTGEDVMVVGHLPHLARVAGVLLAGDADRHMVKFRNAALVGLEQEADVWSVFVVLPPPVD